MRLWQTTVAFWSRWPSSSRRVSVGFGVLALLGLGTWGSVAVLVSVAGGPRLRPDAAADLVRHYLRLESSGSYAAAYRSGKLTAESAQQHASALRQVADVASTEVGRLLPDYLLSNRPVYFIRVRLVAGSGAVAMRHFRTAPGGDLVVAESSAFVWLFVW